MSREKSGLIKIIAILLLIIILIVALFWWIITPPSDRITATAFISPPRTETRKNEAIGLLKNLGFNIRYEGEYIITFSSKKDHFEEIFDTTVVTEKYSPIGKDFLQEIENAKNGIVTYLDQGVVIDPTALEAEPFRQYYYPNWPRVQDWKLNPSTTQDTIVLAQTGPSPFEGLNPYLTTSYYDLTVFGAVFEGLTRKNPATSEVIPALATSWQVEDDDKTWTINLRQGVKWHDGVDFTAEDVQFTFEAAMAPELASPTGPLISSIIGSAGNIEVVNDHTLMVFLPQPYPSFVSDLLAEGTTGWILPKHVLETIPYSAWRSHTFNTGEGSYTSNGQTFNGPIGTGPYKYDNYDPVTFANTMTRNDQWWGSQPDIQTYVVTFIEGSDPAITALKTGEVDILDAQYNLQEKLDSIESSWGEWVQYKSPHEDFLQEVENNPDVELEDFFYVYHNFTRQITIPPSLVNHVETVKFSPPLYFSESSTPPTIEDQYYINLPNAPNLNLPHQLRDKLNVTDNYTINGQTFPLNGEGIKVAIIDTGFYEHQYFKDLGLKVEVESTSEGWLSDLINMLYSRFDIMGHGTVVAANLLAVAPNVECTMVTETKWEVSELFMDWYQSLDTAINLDPDIIVVSWGTGRDEKIEEFIINAIRDDGITFVFSCGNLGQNDGPTFPSVIPDVISVGGAYPLPPGLINWIAAIFGYPDPPVQWNASSYALSGYNEYYDRFAPDVCGVVGQGPNGQLIMTPTGIGIDVVGSTIRGDRTGARDGWAILSGTSSAAPQVAGAAALMLQVNRDLNNQNLMNNQALTPAKVKSIICNTATDVTQGKSATGYNATVGEFEHQTDAGVMRIKLPDSATGYGVINVQSAIQQTIDYLLGGNWD